MILKIIKKKEFLISFGIILVALVWGILNFDTLLNQGGDNARYITLGRSIMEGKFMREVNTAKENLHTQYPPLFPMILSFIMTVFGRDNIFVMKMFSFLCYILSVFFLYKTLGLYLKEKILIYSLTGLFLLCKNIVDWSSLILTESLFILAVILILYMFKMYDNEKKKKHLFMLLTLSALLVFIRGNGSLVFIPLTLYFILKKEWKNLLIMCGFALISQIWGFYILFTTGEGSVYFRQVMYKNWYLPYLGMIDFKTLLTRIFINFLSYFSTIMPMTFSASMAPKIQYGIVLLIYFVSMIWGLVLMLRRKMYFEPVWFFVNMCMLLLWPENFTTDRFFAPFVSLLLLIIGLSFSVYKRFEIVYYLSIGFIFVSMFLNIYVLSQDIPRRMYMLSETDFNFRHDNKMRPEQGIRTFFDIAIWAKDSIPQNAVIMTTKPELFYLYSDRKAIIFPYSDEDSVFMNYMRDNEITYVVYENTQNEMRLANLTINKFLLRHKSWFEFVYTIKERPSYILIKYIGGE
ncbi:TPA: hypothetical protein DCW38_00355 [candidate division WOR-3 bacterium]|uniref:Glycosyltransferase RgtA/B/C/D-like domain-containing protein n=1 Tax=candidate division WOR-3 bacterium TaxID=2052148 RepID=A0A350H7W1_UNCW3|nr:hypothetical protein [candidate division WOR-3 bacterium]